MRISAQVTRPNIARIVSSIIESTPMLGYCHQRQQY
jgi:hypothetical protein